MPNPVPNKDTSNAGNVSPVLYNIIRKRMVPVLY